MKKTGIVLGIVIIVLGGLLLIGRPTDGKKDKKTETPPSVNQNSLSAEETFFDFGTISMANGKVSHVFKVKNANAETVKVSKIYTSCMCTQASIKTQEGTAGPFGMPGHGIIPKVNKNILPNEEAEVGVIFDPAAHGPAGIGRIERTVYVESDNNKPLTLNFVVTVTP